MVPSVLCRMRASTMTNPSSASSLACRSSRSLPSSHGDSSWAARKLCHWRQPVSYPERVPSDSLCISASRFCSSIHTP